MKGILADVNIQAHTDALVKMLEAEPWGPFWKELNLPYFHFGDVGLDAAASDAHLWHTCQKLELVLITDNRNQDTPDSLEATIRDCNRPFSLPIITIGNVPTLRQSRAYANRVVEKLLDFLERMDSLRGSGRLYVP